MAADGDSAEFPLHKDTNEWFGYIIEGEGTLLLGTEMDTTETVKYKAGDIVIFRPDTYHGWKSDIDVTKLMFVKPSAVV